MENMDELVETLLDQPQKLGWIDFSFNYITTIDEVGSQIRNTSSAICIMYHTKMREK